MTKITFSKAELVQILKEQLATIDDLCGLYDQGKVYVVKDIAVKLRVLFHNTDSSKALIHQLKLTHLPLNCSCTKYVPGAVTHMGLSMHRLSEHGTKYDTIAPLTMQPFVSASLENWWNSKLVIVDSNNNKFTRRKIIMYAANKDGGAHVQPDIDKEYYDLVKTLSSGVGFGFGNETVWANPIPPSIRQIAFEVLETYRTVDIFAESKMYERNANNPA